MVATTRKRTPETIDQEAEAPGTAVAERRGQNLAPADVRSMRPESAALINAIQQAIANPEIDLDKMERMYRMHKEVMAEQAERDYFEALRVVQGRIPVIKKGRPNTHTSSKYADLSDILRIATPVITAGGFSLSFGTEPSPIEGHMRITCACSHIGGHTRPYAYDLPIDGKGSQGGKSAMNPLQGSGSTTSYGRRYLTCMIFNIATGDDNDGNSTEKADKGSQPITDEQLNAITDLVEALGASKSEEQAMLAWISQNAKMEVTKLSDIPQSVFKQTVAALKQKIKLKKKAEAEGAV